MWLSKNVAHVPYYHSVLKDLYQSMICLDFGVWVPVSRCASARRTRVDDLSNFHGTGSSQSACHGDFLSLAVPRLFPSFFQRYLLACRQPQESRAESQYRSSPARTINSSRLHLKRTNRRCIAKHAMNHFVGLQYIGRKTPMFFSESLQVFDDGQGLRQILPRSASSETQGRHLSMLSIVGWTDEAKLKQV